jgi:hypothetical protein
MKIFLSWSGERSLSVAKHLRDWIPLVLPGAEPWLSTDDIRKGSRWQTEIGGALQSPMAGILCLTKDNLESPWLHFEAGAIFTAAMGHGMLCTYLIDINNGEVPLPMGMFQSTLASREDTLKLIADLNRLMSSPVPEDRLKKLYETFWPELNKTIAAARSLTANKVPAREATDLLQEILTTVRGLARADADRTGKEANLADVIRDLAATPGTSTQVLFRRLDELRQQKELEAALLAHARGDVPPAESS